MVALTPEMQELFKATKHFAFATASKDGEPNVVPIGMAIMMDPETIWIGDQFFKRTLVNVKENPRVALLVWTSGAPGCLKLKGEVTLVQKGPDYERMYWMVKERKPNLECKGLLIMKITEVYDCRSGPEAGKRLL